MCYMVKEQVVENRAKEALGLQRAISRREFGRWLGVGGTLTSLVAITGHELDSLEGVDRVVGDVTSYYNQFDISEKITVKDGEGASPSLPSTATEVASGVNNEIDMAKRRLWIVPVLAGAAALSASVSVNFGCEIRELRRRLDEITSSQEGE